MTTVTFEVVSYNGDTIGAMIAPDADAMLVVLELDAIVIDAWDRGG